MSGSLATAPASSRRSTSILQPALLGTLLAVAIAFVSMYVIRYYTHYSPAGFRHYWPQPRRAALLLHITCGTLALLSGPLQFSTRLRRRSLQLHRITGRVYLIAVAFGSLGAFILAGTIHGRWAWAFGLAMLAVAWLATSGMAYYTILRRQIEQHKEWMIRSYVITFGFVTFRAVTDYGPTSHLRPINDLLVTAVWACWVLPLLFAEVILGLRRSRKLSPVR